MRISDWSSDVCSSDLAALLLRQAAEKEPQRNDIGIKLAETYFAAGKTAEFAQTAAALKPKVSASEWQKLAIMGQQLDPGAAQFSDKIGRASCRERVCKYV